MKRTTEPPVRRSTRQSRRRLNNGPTPGATANHGNCGVLSMLTPELCVQVLKFASIGDLADVSCVSKHCREWTTDPALSQDRWGTLTIARNIPVATILSKLANAQNRGCFRRINCLKIRYLDSGGMETATIATVQHLLRSIRLPTIAKLLLSAPTNDSESFADVPNCIPAYLSKIMPNLRDVTLQVSSNQFATNNFSKHCRLLQSFVWNDCGEIELPLDLRGFKKSRNLTNLSLDRTAFRAAVADRLSPGRIQFLLHVRDHVERVSVMGVIGWFYDPINETILEPIPEEALVQFVRHAPRLRWFRSDLSLESTAMLEAERPEITFVSD